MATQPSGQSKRRPTRATNNAAGGNGGALNPSVSKATRPAKPSTVAGRTAKFIFTPEIGRSFESVKFAWHLLINLIAQIYVSVKLIPADHPCTELRNAPNYKLFDIIHIAYKSLKWEKDQIPQIVIFFAVLAFLFFVALSLITLMLHLGVNAAHAANGTPNGADDILNQIFNIGGAGMIPTALGAMLRVYSNIILVLAGLILIWTIVTYVIESARHGQAGGKSFNHGWAPMRLVFALGLLIPLSSGLNSGQYITLYLAKWGSDMASRVYKQFYTQIGLGQGITSNDTKTETQKPLAKLFDLYLEADRQNNSMPGSIVFPPALENVKDANGNPTNYQKLVFRSDNPSLGQQKGAGEIVFYYNPNAQSQSELLMNKQYNFLMNHRDSISQLASDVASRLNPQDDTNYFKEINTGAFKVALQLMAKNYSSDIDVAYQDAVNTENQELAQKLQQSAQGLGWVSAPIWFQQVGEMNAQMQKAKDALPTVTTYGPDVSDQLLGNALENQKMPDKQGNWWQWLGERLASIFSGPWGGSSVGVGGNIGAHLYKAFIIDSANPLGSIIALGHAILVSAQVIIAGWTILAGVLGASATEVQALSFGFSTQVGMAMLEALTPLVTGLIGLLFVNGYMLAILFPLIPIIRFIFAVLGWVALVLIGVMGMPLFALAHLKTGGEGWIGQLQVASAYNMLIGIVIRPTLIILGFVLGIILFNQAVKLGATILIAGMDAGNNSIDSIPMANPFNFTTQILTMFLFSAFAVAMANACFKMVEVIPSQAMTWMGTGPMTSPTEDGMNEIQSSTQSFAGQLSQFQQSKVSNDAKRTMELGSTSRHDHKIEQDAGGGGGSGDKTAGAKDAGKGGAPTPITITPSAQQPNLPSVDMGAKGAEGQNDGQQSMQTALPAPSGQGSASSGGNASGASSPVATSSSSGSSGSTTPAAGASAASSAPSSAGETAEGPQSGEDASAQPSSSTASNSSAPAGETQDQQPEEAKNSPAAYDTYKKIHPAARIALALLTGGRSEFIMQTADLQRQRALNAAGMKKGGRGGSSSDQSSQPNLSDPMDPRNPLGQNYRGF